MKIDGGEIFLESGKGVFLSGLPRLCEAVAGRYERTRQFRATTRSARAISRQNPADFVRNAFKLRQKNISKFYIQRN